MVGVNRIGKVVPASWEGRVREKEGFWFRGEGQLWYERLSGKEIKCHSS